MICFAYRKILLICKEYRKKRAIEEAEVAARRWLARARLRLTQRQKALLESEQKKLAEEKVALEKSVEDKIQYATTLEQSLHSTKEMLQESQRENSGNLAEIKVHKEQIQKHIADNTKLEKEKSQLESDLALQTSKTNELQAELATRATEIMLTS